MARSGIRVHVGTNLKQIFYDYVANETLIILQLEDRWEKYEKHAQFAHEEEEKKKKEVEEEKERKLRRREKLFRILQQREERK